MKPTLDQKNYALMVLSVCMSQATDSCDLCEDMIAGECETCGTNGADLVDAVSDMILSLREDLLAAGRKV